MKKTSTLLLLALITFGLSSCNSNDDESGITELGSTGIVIDDDVDCCSAEEALQVYKFIQTVKIIPELTTEVEGKYKVFAYSKTGQFHVGYNDIYFVATKKNSGNYVKNFDITNITPLMTMGEMNMKHSTPVGSGIASFDSRYLAVKRGWISFLMPTSEQDSWTLSYDVNVLSSKAQVANVPLQVNALAQGQTWLKSFKVGDQTYFISLVNPQNFVTGTNTITAHVSKKSTSITTPYAEASETFVIDFTPTMPDMGGHTSPDNVALTKQADGSYQGLINLTMTGYWKIDATVKDKDGNILAEGVSFDVTI